MVLTGRKAYEQGPARESDSRQFHQCAVDVPPWYPITRLNPNRPPFEARYNKVGLMANHVPGEADKPDLLRIREVVYLAWLIPMKTLVQIQHPQPQASLRASADKMTGIASGKTLPFIKKIRGRKLDK